MITSFPELTPAIDTMLFDNETVRINLKTLHLQSFALISWGNPQLRIFGKRWDVFPTRWTTPPRGGGLFFGNNVFTTRHNHDMNFLLLQISNLTEEVSL